MEKTLRLRRKRTLLSRRRRAQTRRRGLHTRRRLHKMRKHHSVQGGAAFFGFMSKDLSDASVQPVGQAHGTHNPYLV